MPFEDVHGLCTHFKVACNVAELKYGVRIGQWCAISGLGTVLKLVIRRQILPIPTSAFPSHSTLLVLL